METTMKIKTEQSELSIIAQGTEGALPLLFLHADCGRATQWQAVLDILRASRQVYALDFHGNGDSAPAKNGDYSYAARVADIEATVKALGLTRFGLVAHSGSVGAALDYAALHRDAVRAIFLLDPAADPRAVPVEMRDGYVAAMRQLDNLAPVQGYYASIAGSAGRVRKQVLEDCATSDPKARTGAAEGLSFWNPDPSLDGWTGPLFILASPITDIPSAFFATRPIAHKIMPNVGHWLQMERPEAVAEEIDHFFEDKQ
jgi:pimeloyl-ACP methyl ester carboxylesterase